MGRREDELMAEDAARAAQGWAKHTKKELNQKRVPSDPNRDTSGDSVYVPQPSDTIHGNLDLRDPVGPDSPVTINGFQTVQVMPLSQYNAEQDLLIINVMVGKMRPDRAKVQVTEVKKYFDQMLADLGWKHTIYVPITYDHPLHRQFRTVNVVDLHGLSDKEKHEVIEKVRDQLKKTTNERHISGRDILDGDIATSSSEGMRNDDDPPPPWDD